MNRQCRTLREKVQLLDQIKQYPRASQRQLVSMLGIPKTTIQRMLSQESFLRQKMAEMEQGSTEQSDEAPDYKAELGNVQFMP